MGVTGAQEEPMKYLCLVYYEEKKLDALSESEEDALMDEVLAYREALRQAATTSPRTVSSPCERP